MKPSTLLLRAISALSAIMLVSTAIAQQVPAEKPKQSITRTDSSVALNSKLTRNTFRIEEYQANYTEKVPYQVTETYYEQVPYEATESYVEQVPYQTTETYTERVPYETTEAYTEYETTYEQQYVCNTQYRQECTQERECRYVPGQPVCRNDRICEPGQSGQTCQMVTECGTNALGQPICKERKVCQDTQGPERCRYVETCTAGSPREECRYENRCRQVPYQDCRYENVPVQKLVTKYRTVTQYRNETRTRTVTKYKSETRYRTVTKYRAEERTRTVTKYREETKCCVTKTRTVFDRQIEAAIVVNFPVETILNPGEKESFSVELSSDGQIATLTVVNSIYGYSNLTAIVSAGSAVFNLGLAPKWLESEVGESAVDSFGLKWANGTASIVISDRGQKLRVDSIYRMKILDIETQALLTEVEGVASAQSQNSAVVTLIPIEVELVKNKDYIIELNVVRSGVVLAAALSFTKTVKYSNSGLNADLYLGEDKISGLRVKGAGKETYVRLVDNSPVNAEVKSKYKVVISKTVNNKKVTVFEKVLDRTDLETTSDKVSRIWLKKNGLTSGSQLPSGTVVTLELTVTRQSGLLNGGLPAEFTLVKADTLTAVQ